jgi:hypothetical protein
MNLTGWVRDVINGYISPRVTTDTAMAKAFAGSGTQTVDAGETNPGDELITNGTFATDSGWYKYGSASIGGGVASLLNSDSSYVDQILSSTFGKYFKVTFTIGTSSARLVVGNRLNEVLAPGTYDRFFISNNGATHISFHGQTGGTATIDNVSVTTITEVLLAPTNLNIELTNTHSYAEPFVTLDPGLLPAGAPVCLTNIDSDGPVMTILSDGPSVNLAPMVSVWYKKASIGWSPCVAAQTPA